MKFFFPVSISLSEHTLCPSKSVAALCTVKKPADSNDFFLFWEYTSPDGMKFECPVLCLQTNVVCDYRDVKAEVKGVDCTCDETEITSEATIYPTCMSGVNLSCSNGVTEQKVSLSVKGNIRGCATIPTYVALSRYKMMMWRDFSLLNLTLVNATAGTQILGSSLVTITDDGIYGLIIRFVWDYCLFFSYSDMVGFR